MRNFAAAISPCCFGKFSTAAIASVIARDPPRARVEKMLLRAEAVVGLRTEEPRIVPGFASKVCPRLQNFCKEARHENSLHPCPSFGNCSDRITGVLRAVLP